MTQMYHLFILRRAQNISISALDGYHPDCGVFFGAMMHFPQFALSNYKLRTQIIM